MDFIFDYLVDERARQFFRESRDQLHFEYMYYDWNLNRQGDA